MLRKNDLAWHGCSGRIWQRIQTGTGQMSRRILLPTDFSLKAGKKIRLVQLWGEGLFNRLTATTNKLIFMLSKFKFSKRIQWPYTSNVHHKKMLFRSNPLSPNQWNYDTLHNSLICSIPITEWSIRFIHSNAWYPAILPVPACTNTLYTAWD